MAASAVGAAAGDGDPALGWRLLFAVTALASLAAFGVYRPRIDRDLVDDARAIVGATAVAALLVTFVRVLVQDDLHAAEDAVQAWLFASVYLIAAHSGYGVALKRTRRQGRGQLPTVILGAGKVGQFTALRLLARPEFGLRPVAFIDPDPLPIDPDLQLPVIDPSRAAGATATAKTEEVVAEIAERYGAGHLIVAFSREQPEMELELMRVCSRRGISVSLVPRLFESVPDQTEVERLGGLPLISVFPSDPGSVGFRIKYAVDRVVASILLVLLSPLLLLIALGTLISSGRPVIFRQPRVGIDGKRFDLLKFRTMSGDPDDEVAQAEAQDGLAPGGVEGEDRRTPFGRLMRRLSLDELPQLINVLRGEMSLVGPRPERVAFAYRFDDEVYRWADRLRVRAGLTGWAQIHGLRGKTSLADRVEWDNYYIENWSPWLDIKILAATLWVVVRDRAE